MKLTTILLMCFLLQVSATGYAQLITINKSNSPIQAVLQEIRKQSGYDFFYDTDLFKNARPVSVSLRNATIDKVLAKCFEDQPYTFTIKNQIVVLKQNTVVNTIITRQQTGKIYGRIIDEKGESLPGANIRVIETSTAAMSMVDGSYSISVAPGTYTVEVSYISFQTKRIADVTVKADDLTKLDVVLLAASKALNTVVVTSSYKKESAAGLYATQKNAASMTDGISAEQIARTPDNNMGQVMKRISGVGTLNNRYVIVRGLTERYNQGMIDGIVLPSTDMNRHNFSFDVIPSEMVSNVVVNKTATPDVSAEFAGGQVSVNTLDIPLENFTILSAGSGFNSNTLGKDFFQAGKRGKYDFLGFDDGHRKLPSGIRTWTGAVPDYALAQSQQFSSDVFRLYNSPGGLNQNYRFSAGRVYNLKNGQKWGFVATASLRNRQETTNYHNVRSFSSFNYHYVQPTSAPMAYIDSARVRRDGHIYEYNTTAGAQLNAGIQGSTYKIGFKNIFSQILNNAFNTYTGANKEEYFRPSPPREQGNFQDPEFTRILQNKLDGEHTLTNSGLKFTWLAARTSVGQQTKDRTKFINLLTGIDNGKEYFQNPNITDPNINSPDYDYRIFTDTRQTDYNWAANLSQSFDFLGDKSTVKAGYNGTAKKRRLSATSLNVRTEDRAFDNFDRPYEEILAPENMGTGMAQAYYLADASGGSQFEGKANFHAGYIMADQRLLKRIRLVYGLRVERYRLNNVQSQRLSSGDNIDITGETNTNYLPSINFTYNLTPKMNIRASLSKTVIRPDFRETSYFGYYDVELDALISGGNVLSTKIKNSDLRYEWYPSAGEIISVSGFYKSFDRPIELTVAQEVSGVVSEYRYQNQKSAENYGVELEIRKSLGFIASKQWLQNISLFGNGTLIRSKVNTLTYTGVDQTEIREDKVSRSLYGQSPYMINAGISYTSDDYGLTLNYNRAGRRTYTISQNPALTQFENGRDQVDLQLFCRLMKKKMELKLNVGNLLNSSTIFYVNSNGYLGNGVPSSLDYKYDKKFGTDAYEKEYDDVRYRFKTGLNSSLSLNYKF